jgi:hypothetical protein
VVPTRGGQAGSQMTTASRDHGAGRVRLGGPTDGGDRQALDDLGA